MGKFWEAEASLWIAPSTPCPSPHSAWSSDLGFRVRAEACCGWGGGLRGGAYRLHGVVHRHECLQAFPLKHVGELHVDGLHGSRVAHDPVLVGIGCIVVTWCAGGKHRQSRKVPESRGNTTGSLLQWWGGQAITGT